jgi:hypothetical protein
MARPSPTNAAHRGRPSAAARSRGIDTQFLRPVEAIRSYPAVGSILFTYLFPSATRR